MGRSYKFTFRIEAVEYEGIVRRAWRSGWDCKSKGRPSDKAAERYAIAMNKSYQPGGVNAHLATAAGVVPVLTDVAIVRQATGEVVGSWKMPKFMVF